MARKTQPPAKKKTPVAKKRPRDAADFHGIACRRRVPTGNHCPVLWETALGAFGAMNPEGETKFFDFDLTAAAKWAGPLKDARLVTFRGKDLYEAGRDQPHDGQITLWSL